MKKRLLTALAGTALLIFLLLPAMAEPSGTCGDNLTWSLNGNTLTISGAGAMPDFTPWNDPAPWSGLAFTSAVIEEGVTSVGNYAFTDNQDIRTVDLPDTLTSIGNSAFWGCSGIQSISIPKNVTTIAIGAFGDCYQLAALEVSEQNSAYTAADNVLYSKDMTKLICCSGAKTGVFRIPQSVTAVFACAFSGCVNLTEVIIPENVSQINSQTFQNCVSLEIIHIPQSVQRVFSYAFDGCENLRYVYYQGDSEQWNAVTFDSGNEKLTDYETKIMYSYYNLSHEISYSLENGVMTVYGDEAVMQPVPWDAENLKETVQRVVFSEGITVIGDSVFQDFTSLTSVSFPQSLIKIGGSAFASCSSLTSVTIPAGVTDITANAFMNCESLTEFAVDAGNTVYTAPDGVLLGWEGYGLLQYPIGNPRTSYTVPSSVRLLFPGWFWEFESNGQIYSGTGDGAFRNARHLTEITLPDGMESIGACVFYGCENLTRISVPASVLSIGAYAFDGCPNLTDIYYSGTKEQWKAVTVASGNSRLESVTIHCSDGPVSAFRWTLDDGVLTIYGNEMPDFEFEATPWFGGRYLIESAVLPEGLENIGNYAFSGCASLTSVNIPESVRTIGENAFLNCRGLTGVVLPENLTKIGGGALKGCESLTEITIPAGVTDIGAYAFSDCGSLTAIHVAAGNAEYSDIDGVLFNAAQSFMIQYPAGHPRTAYAVPDTVEDMYPGWGYGEEGAWWVTGGGVFRYAGHLSTVTLPSGITLIPSSTFCGCENLTDIWIPASVTDIREYAFADCPGLVNIHYAGTAEQWQEIAIGSGNDPLAAAAVFCGDGKVLRPFRWSVENGVLTISGSEMPDYDGDNGAPWDEYRESIQSVVVAEGMTNIGAAAFAGYSSLNQVSIPSSVTAIGNQAFRDCENLTGVSLSDGLISIGNNAFEGCVRLSGITLPDGLTSIGNGAFANCGSLTGITLPEGLISIGGSAFSGCGLTSITIPASVTEAGGYMFSDCQSLTEILVAPGNATLYSVDGVLLGGGGYTLWEYPAGNPRTSYTIPSGVTHLLQGWYTDINEAWGHWFLSGGGVFRNARHLTAVTIPEGVTEIPECTFYGCENLVSISIPVSVTEIDGYAFGECANLVNISYGGTKEQWNALSVGEGNDHFTSAAVQCSDGMIRPFKWSISEEGVLTISGNEIPDYAWDDGEWHARAYEITSVIIGEGVQRIGRYAFADCIAMEQAVIPQSVTDIAASAFSGCSALTDVILPSGLTDLGSNAFNRCTSLTEIALPDSLNVIGINPFNHCSALSSILVSADHPALEVVDGALYSKADRRLVSYPAGSAQTVLTVPQGTQSIGNYACSGASGLTSVILPDSIGSIGLGAFSGTGLSQFVIPDGVTRIEEMTFYQCQSLSSITIPAGVTEIIGGAFWDCAALETVHYGGSPEQWQLISISDGNDPLASVAVIYARSAVTPGLSLPAALTVIESEAFAGLPEGSEIYIPASVAQIASDAFGGTNVVIYAVPGSTAETFALEKNYTCILVEE